MKMNGMWEPSSDDDDDDADSLDGQELEYDMWEGQFDLIATENNIDYSERFNYILLYLILLSRGIYPVTAISHSN